MTDNRPRLAGYLLIDRFAVGGAAEIYRGYDEKKGEIVAIKRLRPDIPFDPEMTSGFLREIQLALLSKHPNLIRGFASGTYGGTDYVVLEYVEGHDLSDLQQRAREMKTTIPVTFSLHVVYQMLEGLAFAHDLADASGRAMGLVHRDLNPRNVMIDYSGVVKLADFGAAVATEQEPAPTQIVGSAGYLSPEQASLGPLDRRSDLFAVGCILYELVVGQPAFDIAGKKDAAVLKAHQKGQIRPVPTSVPEPVRMIIEIATSRDPDDRYRSARVMRDAVARVHPSVKWDDTRKGLGIAMQRMFAKERAARAINKVT